MLEIRIDIVPFGQESMRRPLEQLYIINTADHPRRPEYGNYDVKAVKHSADGIEVRFVGKIKGHPRDRGYWPLIRKAIKALDSE